MADVVDLDSQRGPPPEPIRLTIEIEYGIPGSNPKAVLNSASRPAVELDLSEVGTAVLYSLISLGNAYADRGEVEVPVAGVLIYRSGLVRVMAEKSEFTLEARRRWLMRCLERAGPQFAELIDERVVPDDPGPDPVRPPQ